MSPIATSSWTLRALRWSVFCFVLLGLVAPALADDPWGFDGEEAEQRLAKDELEVLSGAWGRPAIGPADAAITIVEFSDFQCPFCAKAQSTLQQIRSTYGDDVRIVFRHLPLDFHKRALPAAIASELAHEQGRFEAYHHELFKNQKALEDTDLKRYAEKLGLDTSTFDLSRDDVAKRVETDIAWSKSLGLSGTPAFFINGRLLVGAQPFEAFAQVIDEEKRRIPLLTEAHVKGRRSMSEALTQINIDDQGGQVGDSRQQIRVLDHAVDVADAPSTGSDTALLTVVVFADLTAPETNAALEAASQVQAMYGDQVRLVVRGMPNVLDPVGETLGGLLRIAHESSTASLELALECIQTMHLNKIAPVDVDGLKAAMGGCGMPADLDLAVLAEKHRDAVKKDKTASRQYGVAGKAALFINGRRIDDVQNQELVLELANRKYNEALVVADVLPAEHVYDWVTAAGGGVRKVIDTKGRPSRGPDDALATLVVFEDFECPYCSRSMDTLATLEREFGDQLQIVHVDFPLSFHSNARPAAEAAQAAHKQGRFWDYAEQLYIRQKELSPDVYTDIAEQIGLDMKKWSKDLKKHAPKAVDADLALAAATGAGGTPTFFLNGMEISVSPDEAANAIRDELALAEVWNARLPKGTDWNSLVTTPFELDADNYGPVDPGASERTPVPTGNRPAKGAKKPLVTIVEFSDFQCPYCSRGASTMDELMDSYGDDVRLVFAHYPLDFHHEAKPAARAAWAADQQGEFWPYHDKLFENQRSLSTDLFLEIATELSMDLDRFERDLNSDAAVRAVEADIALGQAVGVRGTPGFFINGRELGGAQPYDKFARVVDEEIAEARQLLKDKTVANRSEIYDHLVMGGEAFRSKKARVKPVGAFSKGKKAKKQVALFVDLGGPGAFEAIEALRTYAEDVPKGTQVVLAPVGEATANIMAETKNLQQLEQIALEWDAPIRDTTLGELLDLDADEVEALFTGPTKRGNKVAKKAAKQAEKFDVLGGPTWVVDGVTLRQRVSAEELRVWLR